MNTFSVVRDILMYWYIRILYTVRVRNDTRDSAKGPDGTGIHVSPTGDDR